jgi:hypothetical protein
VTAESAEFEIRRLPGVFACQAGSRGLVVFVDPDVDATMVRTRAAEILSLLAPGLPMQVIGGTEPASTPPTMTHRGPVLVGVAGVAALALIGTVAALGGVLSSTHPAKSPRPATPAEGFGVKAPRSAGGSVSSPPSTAVPLPAGVPASSNPATLAVPARPALPVSPGRVIRVGVAAVRSSGPAGPAPTTPGPPTAVDLAVLTPAAAVLAPLPVGILPVVPFPVVARPTVRRRVEVVMRADAPIHAERVTVSTLAHRGLTGHRREAIHGHHAHAHHDGRS